MAPKKDCSVSPELIWTDQASFANPEASKSRHTTAGLRYLHSSSSRDKQIRYKKMMKISLLYVWTSWQIGKLKIRSFEFECIEISEGDVEYSEVRSRLLGFKQKIRSDTMYSSPIEEKHHQIKKLSRHPKGRSMIIQNQHLISKINLNSI